MVLNSAPPGVCPDSWWEWPRGQSGVKLEEREKTPSSPYNGQMCKSRTGEPIGPSHQVGSSWGPTMACPQAATQGQGSPCCLVGWNQHSKAALNP